MKDGYDPLWVMGKRLAAANIRLEALAAAFVGENQHPDCHPAYRFHACMPSGRRYYPTRDEAVAAVLALADGPVGDSTPDADSRSQATRGVAFGGSVEPTH